MKSVYVLFKDLQHIEDECCCVSYKIESVYNEKSVALKEMRNLGKIMLHNTFDPSDRNTLIGEIETDIDDDGFMVNYVLKEFLVTIK